LGPVGEFEARTVSGDATDVVTNKSPVPERLTRDACVLHFDVNAVQTAWNNWTAATGPNKPQTFLDALGASHPAYRDTASRWARAVTNRRVGVAFSGGGASSYRIEPVAAQLKSQGVPVDVFLGLSGGAFLGAYYVHAGLRGLHTAAQRGLFFQMILPSVMLSTLALRLLIDADVGWARVEDQELRFVAVTTELPHHGPPRVTAVVKGTLGEAAQASGTLPPAFAPTVKNGARYTDGGASTLVPSRIARDYGPTSSSPAIRLPVPPRAIRSATPSSAPSSTTSRRWAA
jgi:predicted acylesterase/phospholipase RssA